MNGCMCMFIVMDPQTSGVQDFMLFMISPSIMFAGDIIVALKHHVTVALCESHLINPNLCVQPYH